jgi:hypothetical protein
MMFLITPSHLEVPAWTEAASFYMTLIINNFYQKDIIFCACGATRLFVANSFFVLSSPTESVIESRINCSYLANACRVALLSLVST